MTRETQIGLLVGLAFTVVIGALLLSDDVARTPSAQCPCVAVCPGGNKPPSRNSANPSSPPAGSLLPQEIHKALADLFSDDAPRRALAAQFLGTVENAGEIPEVLAALKKASRDDLAQVRTEAAVSLAKLLLPRDYVRALVRMLGNPEWDPVRLYTHVAALAEQSGGCALHLLSGVNDENPTVRSVVRSLIAGMPAESAEAFWVVAVFDWDTGSRHDAITALALLGDKALPMLTDKLDGPESALAVVILTAIAGDEKTRTTDEWKAWIVDRLGTRQPPRSSVVARNGRFFAACGDIGSDGINGDVTDLPCFSSEELEESRTSVIAGAAATGIG